MNDVGKTQKEKRGNRIRQNQREEEKKKRGNRILMVLIQTEEEAFQIRTSKTMN